MKLKNTVGIDYLLNSILSNPDEIKFQDFVNDALANKFYKELTINWNMWKTLIEEHNKNV